MNWKQKGKKKARELIILDRIYRAIDVPTLVADLKLDNVEIKDHCVRSSCPFGENHKNEDRHRSFSIMTDGTGRYNCFVCGSGTIVKLLMKMWRKPFKDVFEWLKNYVRQNISQTLDDAFGEKIEPRKPTFRFTKEQLEAVVHKTSLYALRRGVTIRIYKKFKLGYDKKAKEVYFPSFNFKGELIGVTKRRTDRKIYVNLEGFEKSDWLYGLEHAKKGTLVYIVEGMFDVLRLVSLGYNTVGTFGAIMSERQAELAIDNFASVCYIRDRDIAGKKGRNRAFDLISSKLPFYTTKLLKHRHDVGEMTADEIKRVIKSRYLLIRRK